MIQPQDRPQKSRLPFVDAAQAVQARIDADRQKAARPAPRRGLAADIRALARLDQILQDMDPDEAVRALQWLDGKYGAEARLYVRDAPPPADGEGA